MWKWAMLLGMAWIAACSTADDAIVTGSDNEAARGPAGATQEDGHSISGGGGDGPTATCGNGLIEGAEVCDGASLGGATCMTLEGTQGMLLCDPTTCTFDTSMCGAAMMPTGGTGG